MATGMLIFFVSAAMPLAASANVFSVLVPLKAQAESTVTGEISSTLNSQNAPSALSSNIGPGRVSGTPSLVADVVISNDVALTPIMGPVGNAADAADFSDTGETVSFYTVQDGDTAGSIAAIFGVNRDTVLAANNLTAGQKLKKGAILTIPPVSGSIYAWKKGDTMTAVAKKFKVKAADISSFNNITSEDQLSIGDTIIVPDPNFSLGSSTTPSRPSSSSNTSSNGSAVTAGGTFNGQPVHPLKAFSKRDMGNYILRPVALANSRESQGAHGEGLVAVDLAAPAGTPIMAATDGIVMLAEMGGWHGGYGNYVIILTQDGTNIETVYGHMLKINVTPGQTVSRGDMIGEVGRSGNATGTHLHFEVRNALNPLTVNRNYTGL